MKKFTLLELLTVTALIAILISLLLPSLAQSREKARQAVCLSNFKQISTGFFLFVKESNGKLPGPLTWLQSNTYTTYTSSLAGQLAPFMDCEEAANTGDVKVNPAFLCPSFKITPAGISDQTGVSIYRSGGRGDARHSSKYGYFGHPTGGNSKMILNVEKPEEEMLLFETDNYFIAFDNTSLNVRHGIVQGMARRTTSYIDGHAKLKMHRLNRN